MTPDQPQSRSEIPSELEEVRVRLARIEELLQNLFGAFPKLPEDAQHAVAARASAQARGFYVTREFAAVIGRSPQWVSENCSAGVILTLRGRKPYRIPLSEEKRWNTVDDDWPWTPRRHRRRS